MEKDVLFEITKEHLETGMRGYPVGYCTTSSVDEKKGLFYVGKPVSEMSHFDPIEVIYLLFHKKLGDKKEVDSFKEELIVRSKCSDEFVDHVTKLPRKGHPMSLFASALQVLGMVEKVGDYREDCLNIIAKLPFVAATVINYHANAGPVKENQPEMGYMENFTHMLNLPISHKDLLCEVLRKFNILHYDHGGGNLSVFVGKAVASGLQHMYGALSAAMNGLAGARHGKANQDCLAFVQEIQTELGDDPRESEIEKFLKNKLEHHDLIFGFGHAVLRVEDPRATIFYDFAQKHFSSHPLVKIALILRKVGTKILQENPKIHDPYPNVDAISGSVLSAAGFTYPEYFTILFGLARCVGIAIQIVYERLEAREGKGTPIIRPRYIFKPR